MAWFIFPPLVCLLWRVALSFSEFSFSGEFSYPLSFFDLDFSVALDPSFRNFFVGVCRIAESEGRPVDFGDLVPSDCVLRRLSEELFALAFPALSTWRAVRDSMVSEGNSGSSIHFEDLSEGHSNRGEDSRSSEETPSVSGSSRVVGSEDSWIA